MPPDVPITPRPRPAALSTTAPEKDKTKKGKKKAGKK